MVAARGAAGEQVELAFLHSVFHVAAGAVDPLVEDPRVDLAALEIQSNTAQMSKLGSEEGIKVAQNVLMGTAGLFIPVLWFGMDFQDAAGKEGKALQQRNSYLSRLAETRCAPPAR